MMQGIHTLMKDMHVLIISGSSAGEHTDEQCHLCILEHQQ